MLWLQRAWRKYFYPLRGSCSTLNQPTKARNTTGPQNSSDNTENSYWHPYYLDWSVLAAFGITFLVLAVSCQILLYYSNKSYGLASSYQGLRYLWTYGPTAILTLIASFWARVECQTKISPPWCRMLKGAVTSQQSVLLDYVSKFQPVAIYTAIKNKDYPVAASILVSLLLRLTIVISTSFIVLSPIDVRIEDVKVTLKSQFVDDPSGLSATGDLALSSLTALISKDVSLPDGVSAKYAYVKAETDIQNISKLATTVDGFEGGLNCEPATVSPVWGSVMLFQDDELWNGQPSLKTVRLKSDSCEMTVDFNHLKPCNHDDYGVCTSLSILPTACDESNSTYKSAIGIVASAVMDSPGSLVNSTAEPWAFHINITILRANASICTPFYEIKPIKTLRTNAEIQVLPVADTTARQLSSVSPWDIWKTHFDSISTSYEVPENWLPGEQVQFDECSERVLQFANYAGFKVLLNFASLFDRDSIVRPFSSYYQQYTAILARVSLMKDASTPSTGSAIVSEQRLLVQIVPTHIMTGLLLLSLTMVVIIWRWQSRLLLPQSPNTIVGNAVLLAHSPLRWTGIGSASVSGLGDVLDRWVYRIDKVDTSATSNHQLLLCFDQRRPMSGDMDVGEMATSTYRPLSLSIAFRSFAFVLIFSVIATLEILLRKSEHNNGIADTPAERSKYQLWTVFPGLLSALISMYSSSVDADTRSQSHLLQLRRGVAFEALSLDLVDRHASILILEEIRSRVFESLASTLAVATTSLLTIFSASLFFSTTLPTETHVQLKPSSLIYYNADLDGYYGYPIATTPNSAGVIILLKNASYPAFTYQDLAFPGLVLDGTPSNHLAQSGVVYNVTVPAVRPSFTACRLYNSSQIEVSVDTSALTNETYLKVMIYPEAGCKTEDYQQIWVNTTAHDHTYFGNKAVQTGFGCSTHVWTWGSWTNFYSDDTKARFQSIHALACNDSLHIVETSVDFIAQTMAVNSYNPPIANYASAVSLTSMNASPYFDFYSLLPQIATTESDADLDSFFTMITSSRYAIQTSYLGDSSKVSAVVDSIQFHHRIMLVQLLDQQWRYPNRTSADSAGPKILPVWDKPTVFNATARDPGGRSRVVVDMASTRVLQSLFAATLVCLGVNWFLMRNIDIIPRSPTSIANWIALLADSNLYDVLPPNAGQMPLDQISRWYFGQDAVFYLGFRKSPVSGKEVLGIYVVSQHSALDEPVERSSPWYERLRTLMSDKVRRHKMHVRQPQPVQ